MAIRTLLLLVLALFGITPLAESRPPAAPSIAQEWDGLWKTTYGRMRLVQSGADVRGSYELSAGSKVEGTVEGDRFTFRYDEETAHGQGWFELAEDGRSFEGKWLEDGTERWRRWTGERIEPERNVRWLIVLEAHWEHGLAEREYAFGDMLRDYFTMSAARHVRVRHRFFHDAVDFQRFAQETRYLAEPVTLLVSTHGSRKGISVGGKTIAANEIADAVRGVPQLDLLHLSGCDMMAGDVPAEIHRRLGGEAHFPITGYRHTVAWDASAISDFVFLSLWLIRGLSIEEAVKQSHLVAPYTKDERVEGSAFAPMGLDLRLPPTAREFDAMGDEFLRAGRFSDAVAAFDAAVERDPRLAPHHWRRGIAHYYAGMYDAGAAQFELHRTVNGNDVENAAWHFLCVARSKDVEAARAGILPVGVDRRAPMREVYEMFAGRMAADEVLAAARGAKGSAQSESALFYAHLYVGLHHEAHGRAELARKHIEIAATEHTSTHYMGDVARVHAATFGE